MDAMNRFKIVGFVVRTYVSDKFAALTIEVDDSRRSKIDFKAFAGDGIPTELRTLQRGARVAVSGSLGMEKLAGRGGVTVKVDGYDKWTPSLKMSKIEIDPAYKVAAPAAAVPPIDDDSVPF